MRPFGSGSISLVARLAGQCGTLMAISYCHEPFHPRFIISFIRFVLKYFHIQHHKCTAMYRKFVHLVLDAHYILGKYFRCFFFPGSTESVTLLDFSFFFVRACLLLPRKMQNKSKHLELIEYSNEKQRWERNAHRIYSLEATFHFSCYLFALIAHASKMKNKKNLGRNSFRSSTTFR